MKNNITGKINTGGISYIEESIVNNFITAKVKEFVSKLMTKSEASDEIDSQLSAKVDDYLDEELDKRMPFKLGVEQVNGQDRPGYYDTSNNFHPFGYDPRLLFYGSFTGVGPILEYIDFSQETVSIPSNATDYWYQDNSNNPLFYFRKNMRITVMTCAESSIVSTETFVNVAIVRLNQDKTTSMVYNTSAYTPGECYNHFVPTPCLIDYEVKSGDCIYFSANSIRSSGTVRLHVVLLGYEV